MLALGLGAKIAMFGVVYGVLLRPLPYHDAAAVVRIGESLGSVGGSDMWLSNRSMPLLEESAGSFERLGGYQENLPARSASLGGATLSGARVSPSLFPLLESRPGLGRLFTEEDAQDGADRVVLLSHGVWTTRFGSDADIVGTVVDLAGYRRPAGTAHGRQARVRWARTTSCRRFAGAGGHGSAHYPAGERRRHHGAGGRGSGIR